MTTSTDFDRELDRIFLSVGRWIVQAEHPERFGSDEAFMTQTEAKQAIKQAISTHIIGKNFGKSVIGDHSERDSKANKLINETIDFTNARLEEQRKALWGDK